MIQELIFFKNTSTMDETLYSSPVGGLSVRQTLIIGVGFSIVLLAALMAYDASKDIMDVVIYLPFLIIPAVLGLHKPKVLTADVLFLSIMTFLISGSSVKQIAKAKRPKGSGKKRGKKVDTSCDSMGYRTLRREFVPKEKMRTFTVTDLAKPTRLKLVIRRPDGEPFVNHFVSVYLDDTRVTAMTTDSVGEVESLVTPGREGTHNLKVVAKGYDKPVMDGKIKFQRG